MISRRKEIMLSVVTFLGLGVLATFVISEAKRERPALRGSAENPIHIVIVEEKAE